ncbi:MAG: radical SAM protein [Deltaproteobacteria bacterium]|nr:radical SAM protein [Deltaproteobacteria bacterium]
MTHPFSTFLTMAPCRRLQFNLSDMFPVPRLGIGYLSAHLKAHGYPNVEVRDVIAEREWIPDLVRRFEERGAPDLLGVSVTILSLREAFAIARAVKERFPTTRVVVGGPGTNGFAAASLLGHGAAVDFFVRGEGEAAMLGLVRALDGTGPGIDSVPGLVWRDERRAARENPRGAYRDLDDGLRVDYAAQPMSRFRLHPPMGVYPYATMMETTRGCSFSCEFCCLSMPVRERSPADVERELADLKRHYDLREVHFIDPTFTLHRSRSEELIERVGRLGLHWSCKTRVDKVDEALAARMARAGCYLIAFGVESGEDDILGALGKSATGERAIETFAACRQHRIRTTAYLLLASPGETEAHVERTIRFVRRLAPDYVLYDLLQVDPANPLTRERIAAGAFTADDVDRYYLTDEPSALHASSVAGHPMEVARARIKRASGDFYVRPRYFWERVRDLRTIQDGLNLGAGGLTFFKDLFGLGKLWDR